MAQRMAALDLEVTALTIDGDQLTLNEVMQQEVLDQCKRQNSRIGKHSAATTSKNQSSDAAKGPFKGTKDMLKKIQKPISKN